MRIQEIKNKKTPINNSQTRTKKIKAQVEYTKANKEVKRNTADKQLYVADVAMTEYKASRKEIPDNYII